MSSVTGPQEHFDGDDEDEIEETSSGTTFQRADPKVPAKRRFVPSARGPRSSSSGSAGGTPTNASPISSESVSSQPRFAMPSLPEDTSQDNTTAAKNPFGSINLTAGSTGIAKSGSQEPKSESAILTEKFVEFIMNADLREDYALPAVRYLTTMNKLLSEERKSAAKDKASSVAPSTTGTTIVSETGTEKSKSLFAPAPAPTAFSFGSTSTAPTFSFSSTKTGFTGSAPASGLSSGFSFAPALFT